MTPAKKQGKEGTAAKGKAAAPKDAAGASGTQAVKVGGKTLGTRGRRFTGTVVSNKMAKTVTVEWERRKFIPKYQRYERRRTRVKAHDELGVKVGDTVEIAETRPISKTKNFLVMRKVE